MPRGRAKNAGKAVIQLSIDDRVAAGLRKISGKLKAFGAQVAGLGAKIAGVGAAIGSAFIYPIKAASDLEETMNKFNVVFGENAGEVKKWGDGFASEVGRSEKQIADFLGSSQDLFVPLGFEPGAATAMSKDITKLSIDLASFNNLADEQPFNDLQAALTGSGEVMKKYGVLVNEAAVKQEILNRGLDPKTATDQQKVQARMAIILRGTTAAQGDAIRSAGGFANVMKALQGKLSDVAAEIGTAVLPTVTSLLAKIRDGVTWVSSFISQNLGLIRVVAIVGASLFAVGSAITGAGLALSVAGVAAGGLASLVGVLGSVFGALISPIGLAVAGVAGLATWFITATEAGTGFVDYLMGKFAGLLDTAKGTFSGIADAMAAGDITLAAEVLWAGLNLAWVHGTEGLLDLWNSLVAGVDYAMVSTWENIIRASSHTMQFLGDMWEDFSLAAKLAINAIWGFFQKAWAWITGASDAELARINKEINDTAAILKQDAQTSTDTRAREAEGDRAASRARQAAGLELAGQGLNSKNSEAQQALEDAKKNFQNARDAAKAAAETAAATEEQQTAVAATTEAAAAFQGVSVGSSSPKGQATLDASFAAQQFGKGTDKQVELLTQIRDDARKANKKGRFAFEGLPTS